MASLQGPVICPVVRAKQIGLYSVPVNSPLLKAKFIRSGFWGLKGLNSGRTNVGYRQHLRKCRTIRSSFSSSSNGNGSMAGNFSENDADYVNSSVLEAAHNHSTLGKSQSWFVFNCLVEGGHLPDYAPHPAIVLKMEDGTGLLLPIIVLEMPSVLLMAAVRNVQIARPTMYHVVKDMVEKMGYTVKLVRVTKRVHEAYFAELHLTRLDNEAESIRFDLRPSDAINIAVRCKVPIQVNKFLAYSDGMKVIESEKVLVQSSSSAGLLFTELDRPTGQPCIETKEFILVRNMLIAAVEERYRDAETSRFENSVNNIKIVVQCHLVLSPKFSVRIMTVLLLQRCGETSSLNFGPRGTGHNTSKSRHLSHDDVLDDRICVLCLSTYAG
ncbi:UNVERIFIED_CONTAM: Bifunctional nuclease 2 [Sesamum latifolium]|uniref:Bifunctional nuclease 2 n=1 Tax=Sesamum latifolium TaxID=2727402 RepID=A0AAW2WCT8_9LAMI